MQPTEVNRLPFWKFKSLVKFISDLDKQREKEAEEAEAKYKTKQKTPKLPKYGKPYK
jgi:hypothetical protein